MSKSGMLRTRRRDVNVKPNRRLDRKSSRGMIYENEELRLRTININAEIERGQSDIKKLRRENELLRKEIWCLRDEYEKLDKLLKVKGADDTSCMSCTSDSESYSSGTESEENEMSQNIENVQKTTLHNLHTEFDHLSVVTEETSAECSDKNSNCASLPKDTNTWNILPPDQSYPNCKTLQPAPTTPKPLKHFFAPLKSSKSYENCYYGNENHTKSSWSLGNTDTKLHLNISKSQTESTSDLEPCQKTSPDILIKTSDFTNYSQESSSFTNGGNLEELLQDIHMISNDILQISGDIVTPKPQQENAEDENNRPYKTELNVVLMPKPMPLLGFEKFENTIDNIKKSHENLVPQNLDTLTCFPNDLMQYPPSPIAEQKLLTSDFYPGNFPMDVNLKNTEDYNFMSTNNNNNQLDQKEENSNNAVNIENEKLENDSKTPATPKLSENFDKKDGKEVVEKSPKMKKTRKVSIYFKGKKDKLAKSLSLDTKTIPKKGDISDTSKTDSSPVLSDKKHIFDDKKNNTIHKTDSKSSLFEMSQPNLKIDDKMLNSDTKTSTDSTKISNYDRKHRKSSSTSPERKHLHVKLEDGKKGHKKRHKKSDRRLPTRNNSISMERQRERSFSVCTDRSHILDHRFGHFDDFTNSERERTNSISSCDTIKSRNISNFPVVGKIPWFGCWGNGCI